MEWVPGWRWLVPAQPVARMTSRAGGTPPAEVHTRLHTDGAAILQAHVEGRINAYRKAFRHSASAAAIASDSSREKLQAGSRAVRRR